MAVTIATTTSATGLRSARAVAATSTGQLWSVHHDNANSYFEFNYSDDGGATWSENADLRLNCTTQTAFTLHIDRTTDRMVFGAVGLAMVFGTGTRLGATVCNSVSSSAVWLTTLSDSATDAESGLTVGFFIYATPVASTVTADIVSFVKPATSNFFVAFANQFSTAQARINVYECTSTGTVVGSRLDYTTSSRGGASSAFWAVLDFNHTGDGSTVASSTPDLYVATFGDNGYNIVYNKLSYSAGSWTVGSARYLKSAGNPGIFLSGIFDGSQFIVAAAATDDTSQILVYERNAADTITYTRSPTDNNEALNSISVTFDKTGDTTIFVGGAASFDVEELIYDRSLGSWGSWSTLHSGSTEVKAGTVSALRGYVGADLPLVFQEGTSTPWDVQSDVSVHNTTPNAPTWVSPADNAGVDVTNDLVLDWAFSDDDAGDEQSAYSLSRSVDGGALSYWTGATWGTETKITTTSTTVTLSSWGSDGESHVYKVKCYDTFGDDVGPYGSGLTVIASTPVVPVLTVPATSATLTVADPTVTWTCGEQSAYRIRVLTSADAEIYSTGWISDTGTRTRSLGYSLDNGLADIKFEVSTKNTEGLAASDTNVTISVTFTAPLVPTYAVTANDAGGYIEIAITDPTPSGTPTVTSHDVFVRVASGGTQSGERTVNDDGIRISTGTVGEDGTYLDYAAPSATDFEYRTLAIAANGASVWGAWS